MCSTNDLADNLNRASERIREAADRGADVVALPENFACCSRRVIAGSADAPPSSG